MYITEITMSGKPTKTYKTETEAESIKILNKTIEKHPYTRIFASFMDEHRNRIGYYSNFEVEN